MINKVAGKNKTESQNLQHKRKLKKKNTKSAKVTQNSQTQT